VIDAGHIVSIRARVVVLGLGLVFSAAAQADGAAIAKQGSGAAPACQTCHGSVGEGQPQMGFPRLAGLGARYLQRQLDAFADGSRANAVMMPIAKALSAADRAEVSAFYAALPVTAAPAASPASAATSSAATASASVPVGATLATRGRWSDKLPACDQCHGEGGRGVGADFPALTGQSASYLANQLTAWKSGARPPGPLGLMAVVANKLSEAELRAVAEHYAAQPIRGTR
jgi:cytochrome c553